MNFQNKVELYPGSTLGGRPVLTDADAYKMTEADLKFATKNELGSYYSKADLSGSGKSSVHWNNVTNKPSYDNYGGWLVKANGEAGGANIGSGGALTVNATGAASVARSGNTLTIGATNNYLTGVSGTGNSLLTLTRSGLGNLSVDLSHTHAISEVNGLEARLTSIQGGAVDAVDIGLGEHKTEDAPHTYGDKFQFAFNQATGALDLQVIV